MDASLTLKEVNDLVRTLMKLAQERRLDTEMADWILG
jgi:hypothetical protein